MEKQVLSNWTLTGYWPYAPVLSNSIETGETLRGITKPMPAIVPGSVYRTLLDNGIIADPYYADNSLYDEWVANRWWMYETVFTVKKDALHARLVIEGIDYIARIYLNGKELGRHEGMFIPFEREVGDLLLDGENRLVVLLECTPNDSAQYGYTSKTFTQRCRFDYKWDFCTRLVGAGIYGNAYIEKHKGVRIENAFVKPFKSRDSFWRLPGEFELSSDSRRDVAVKATLTFDGAEVCSERMTVRLEPGSNRIALPKDVENPLLWWTNGAGDQPLYTYVVDISENGCTIASRSYRIAFRTFTYRRADGSADDSLPYLLEVNGKSVYLKGVNLVPYDLMEKYATREQYRAMLAQARDANINLIRVWGGGVIESEDFYDFCDEYGIAVWQEFIQSSSGCDNVPSKQPDFLEKLERTSRHAICSRRNHACLAYWSGGNELCDERFVDQNDRNNHPATYDDPNIALLRQLVEELDPDTLMLPTSASGPISFLDPEAKGINHDVHGPWMYAGQVNHYMIYNKSDSILHSEFGCNGMSSPDSIRRILPPEAQGVFGFHTNYIWEHRGGSWWDTQQRDEEVFGPLSFDELDAYAKLSQFLQAEGIRYAVEANMRRAWQNCGSIVWQYNEPWPNVVSTSIVEYGCRKKLAWYFLRDAYRPLYASLRYDKLCWEQGEDFSARCFVYNEGATCDALVLAEVVDSEGSTLHSCQWKAMLTENGVTDVGVLKWAIPTDIGPGFYLRLHLLTEGRVQVDSEYLFLIKDKVTGFCDKEMVLRYVDRRMRADGESLTQMSSPCCRFAEKDADMAK